MNTQKVLSLGNWSVLGVTFVLFVMAVFTQGMTHDILLETGVFLISVKLILSTHQILMKLDIVLSILNKKSID